MGAFLTDFRYGLRMLAKNPGLAAISVIALGLGLGLTTTMWSIVWGGILRGLPFEQAEQIVHLERSRPSKGIESYGVPMSDFVTWREQQRSFDDLAAYSEGTINLSGPEGKPERFEGGFITAATFPLLHVEPVKGRLFDENDTKPGAEPVTIIGWTIWQNRFGGDPDIVGKTLRTNGTPATIVGVMPSGFLFPTNAEIWLPKIVNPSAIPWGQGEQIEVMGRLKDGVTIEQARGEFATITARIAAEHKEENEGVNAILQPFTDEYIGPEPVLMLWTMLIAVFGVLLIACSNVANLLLARAVIRTREVAVRTALGASRWRIASQLLAEALVLAVAGSLLGLGIAAVGTKLFMDAVRNSNPPFWIDIKLDGTVLAFCAGVTILAALVSGVIPALQATKSKIHDVLKDEGRGSSSIRIGRFSRGLVMAELALSGGLLVGAGFMIQSVVQLTNFDYGVETTGYYSSRIGLFESTYPDTASRERFWVEVERRLEALPGHRGVALTTALPGLPAWYQSFAIEGKTYGNERDYPETRRVAVTPAWFDVFQVKPSEGRLFRATDVRGSMPVAVVTRRFATTHFGASESPLGKRIRIGGEESRAPWLTVIGVVPDVWFDGTDNDAPLRTAVFTPIAQDDYRFLSIVIAAQGEPMSFTEPVQKAVNQVDPDQPVYFASTLDDAIARDGWFYGVFGTLFMVFGGAALFLATVGVYGVVSFAASQRTREIGVRMALGASGRDVLRLFLRQGGFQIAIGLTVGLVLAFFLSKGLSLVMFQVDIGNPFMYAGVMLALAATSLLATYVPARRAMAVDPTEALRYE